MSTDKKEICVPEFDPKHITTYTNALVAFTEQVSIQNQILEQILHNTDGNPDVPRLLSDIKTDNHKVLTFLESKDGLDKTLEENRNINKQVFQEVGANIVIKISLILAGAGALFNAVLYWVQKALMPDTNTMIQTIEAEVIKQLGKQNGG
jgi:DNA mismatch repair ATPase MutS